MKKDYGGLGIQNLRDINMCLLGNWIKRYYADEGKIWRELVAHKYLHRAPNIFACKNQNSSRFWKGVLWAAKAVQHGCRWVVGSGTKTRLWEDIWFGTSPLAVQF